MKAPTYVECNLVREKYREICDKRHNQRLQAIKQRRGRSIMTNYKDSLGRLNESLTRAHRYALTLKESEIQRANQRLLEKLTDISQGKVNEYKKARNINGTKSLNFVLRKKENQRIERENLALAQRLLDNPTRFSHKILDSEYQTHLAIKNRLQRVGHYRNASLIPNKNGSNTEKSLIRRNIPGEYLDSANDLLQNVLAADELLKNEIKKLPQKLPPLSEPEEPTKVNPNTSEALPQNTSDKETSKPQDILSKEETQNIVENILAEEAISE